MNTVKKVIATQKEVSITIKNIGLLRISIGLIFIWFGVLKFFTGLSPAENLAIITVQKLSFHLLNDQFIRISLAILEVMIGIGLLFKLHLRFVFYALLFQMVGTFMPLFLFPTKIFTTFPYGLTLEGQYIIKNLVIIAAALVIRDAEK